jgi:MerR family transcriptional regulator, copper efflux regulator
LTGTAKNLTAVVEAAIARQTHDKKGASRLLSCFPSGASALAGAALAAAAVDAATVRAFAASAGIFIDMDGFHELLLGHGGMPRSEGWALTPWEGQPPAGNPGRIDAALTFPSQEGLGCGLAGGNPGNRGDDRMAGKTLRPELADARQQGFHNIGEASSITGVSAKMIRHYESIGLIPQASRTFAGYRLYADTDLHRLHFIKRSRTLGFSMKQIETLLALWGNQNRASSEVKKLAQAHARELGEKIAEMQAMQRTLIDLSTHCRGNQRPDCPILDDLAG